MAEKRLERLIKTNTLNTSRLSSYFDQNQVPFMYYDDVTDDLIITIVPNTVETVVHYIDDNVALLYDPESNEVVGFQVEAFKHSFMAKHISLSRAWRLSDSGYELKDVADLGIVFEQKKRIVAREIKSITDSLLRDGDWNISNQLIPA